MPTPDGATSLGSPFDDSAPTGLGTTAGTAAGGALARPASAPTFRVVPRPRGKVGWNDRHGIMFSWMNQQTHQSARSYFGRPRELRENAVMGHLTKKECEYFSTKPFRRETP